MKKSVIAVMALMMILMSMVTAFGADNDTGETPEIQYNITTAPDLNAKAVVLATPVKIYEYLLNNAEYSLYHGSRSGSINTFLSLRGSDVDLASTLIAMYRSRGIHARYAVGTVQVAAAQATNWLGVKNLDLAVSIMKDQGIQGVSLSTDRSYVSFEHVWVEAQLPYGQYRGAGQDATNTTCTSASNCRWVALDPSFKQKVYNDQGIDPYSALSFDYTSYYNAIKNSDATRMNKNPQEIYEEQILTWLRTNYPGKTLNDVAYMGEIITQDNLILPASLPYTVVGTPRRYNSVADHDAVVGVNNPDKQKWKKNVIVQFNIYQSSSNMVNGSGGTFSLVDASTKSLTVSYDHNLSSLVIQMDGNIVATVVDGQNNPINMLPDTPFDIVLTMDGAPGATQSDTGIQIDASYSNCKAGGYYLIATGGETSNWSQVHRAASKLLQANQDYKIVNNSAGVPYVDLNKNGIIDAGEPLLLDYKPAMDALSGGLLQVAAMQYFTKYRESIERVDLLNKTKTPIVGLLGVISSVNDVEYIDGTSFSVLPGGLLIDMKGARLSGIWRIDQPATWSDSTFLLNGHIGSSLEHEIWQELTGYDAVSTVRGIQMALADGATLLNPKKNATADTLPAMYPQLGFSTTPPINALTYDLKSYNTGYAGWYFPSQLDKAIRVYQQQYLNNSMEVLKKSVDASTSALRKKFSIYPYTATFNFTNIIDSYCANLYDLYWNTSNTVTNWNTDRFLRFIHYPDDTFKGVISGTYYDFREPVGSLGDGTNGSLWKAFAENFYSFYLQNKDFIDFFDIRKGYNESEYVFRKSSSIGATAYDVEAVADLRNDLYLRDVSQGWVEYLLPSTQTTGSSYRFMVDLRKFYQTSPARLVALSFEIKNNSFSAGGGYVPANGTLLQQATSTTQGATSNILPTFNNAVFTNQNNIAQTNNDVIKTPSTADPVSTVTGNNYHDETDFTIKGRRVNIAFTRTYNSVPASTKADGPLGFGWTHSYNMRLKSNDYGSCPNCTTVQAAENGNNKTSSITYTDERGGEHNYLVNETTYAVTPPSGEFDTLALDTPSAGYYTITFRNGVKYIFQGTNLKTAPGNTAKLTQIADPYGNQLNFTYTNGNLTAITDNLALSGRTGLVITYWPSTIHIKEITDWSGRKWSYAYDGNNNLQSVTNPIPKTIQYTYHPGAHNLNEVILPETRSGQTVKTAFKYYQNGKTFNYSNSLGHTETMDYDLYRKSTRVTDPRGFIREYEYDQNGLMTKLTEPDNAILQFDNSADFLRYKKTDGLGYTSTYSYRADHAASGASDTGGNVTQETDPLTNTLQYSYGIYDQITTVKDKNGNTRTMAYYTSSNPATGAVAGKLQSITLGTLNGTANVLLRSYTYNPDGTVKQMVEQIDPANSARKRITDYTWQNNGLNLYSMVVSGSGQLSQIAYGYDSLGRKTTETVWRRNTPSDPTLISLTTTYTYDALDRVTRITDHLGNIIETVYDGNGKVQRINGYYKKPDNSYDTRVINSRTYDAADRLVTDTDIYNNVTTYAYDEAGNLIHVTDANGHVTRYEYDPMNRRTAVIDANGYKSTTVYDLAGHPVQAINPLGKIITTVYDALDRPVTLTDSLTYQTTFGYDTNSNVTKMTDANANNNPSLKNSYGATLYKTYDELNRVKSETDALNGVTAYTYDLLGNITSITDAESRVTYFDYDDLGRLIRVRDPLYPATNKATTFTYYETGDVLTRTKRSGATTTYTLDNLNRVTQAYYNSPTNGSITESTAYDIYGNKYTVSNPDVMYTYAYDLKNRPTLKMDGRQGKFLQYTYDNVGNIGTKTNYDGSTTEYRYDSANKLVAERNPDFLEVSYQYDGAGRLLSRILSNGAMTSYTWDDGNRLASLTNKSAIGTIVNNTSYTRDRIGNITSQSDASGTTSFVYDPLYRLTSADYPGTANDQSFTYDKVGNRKTMTKGGTTVAYVVDTGNRMKEIRQSTQTGALLNSFVYDDDGNLTAKKNGSGTTIQSLYYDVKGRTTSVNSNSFKYDPYDYRIYKSDSHGSQYYLLEGEHLEAITNGTNWLAKYFRGAVIDEIVNGFQYDTNNVWTNYTFHHDALQSVLGLSGHEGSVLQTISYGPFGEKIATTGTANNNYLHFTGREEDSDSGLYNYRARIYDPTIGRFLTEDPKGFDAGVNFYVYVQNNPVNANDPMGLETEISNGTPTSYCHVNPHFDRNENKIGGLLVGGGLASVYAAPIFTMNSTEIAAYMGRISNGVYNTIVATGSAILTGAEKIGNGIDSAMKYLFYGSAKVDAGSPVVQNVLKYGVETIDAFVPGPPSPTIPGRIMGLYDLGNYITEQVSGNEISSSAAGGFVIYPNKTNLNMMHSVYSK